MLIFQIYLLSGVIISVRTISEEVFVNELIEKIVLQHSMQYQDSLLF